jgi:fluoride exporter
MWKVINIALLSFVGGMIRGELTWLAGDQHIWITILINVSGAFLLAFLTSWVPKTTRISAELWLGIKTGLVGGYTTFSTFCFDSLNLGMHNKIGLVILYMGISLIGGFLLAILGTKMGNQLAKWRLSHVH